MKSPRRLKTAPKQQEMIDDIKANIKEGRRKDLLKLTDRLSKLETDAFGPNHSRFAFYSYLEEVLEAYWSWKDEAAGKTRGEQLGALAGIPPRKGRKSLHFLVLATSRQRIEVKNRWIHALRFAAKKRSEVEKNGLAAVVGRHGGIAGCARLGAKARQLDRE
jgi:hypothetical protein